MAHTTKDKEKLLNRISRIKGQINAIEKALDGNEDCSKVLQTIAAPHLTADECHAGPSRPA